MRKFFPSLCIALTMTIGSVVAQPLRPVPHPRPATPARPKILIGLVVDQMRWDYLIRFRARYGTGGFRRLVDEGFSCDNALIDYSPSVTACGHTAVYTGSVPAITGIMGNDWYDRYRHKRVYCTEDTTGRMSPDNLLTTTIGDELNMADNFTSKIVGIALKDRAAILPAGHTATAAFWFDDKAGHFISDSYYMQELPAWAQRFNATPHSSSLAPAWTTLYPVASYTESAPDDAAYEISSPGEQKPVFPHRNGVRNTPSGADLTLDFARAAIEGYKLGAGKATDLLAISLSSPDATGHQYGPNSVEIEDTYLRLDRQLASFFTWLDTRFGKGNYLLFLTADHGVASSPGYSLEHRMPGGGWDIGRIIAALNDSLASTFQVSGGIESVTEGQLYLNRALFSQKGIALATVEDYITGLSASIPGIAGILPEDRLESATLPADAKNKLINGYNLRRSGDMIILPLPGWKAGSPKGADHGLVYPYDTHIPLVFMGWKIKPGRTNHPVAMTDIAPTLAALLQVQMPSGCIGRPIEEIIPGFPRSSHPRHSPGR
jgi:predicted AlkP superfamily pyrophosphatase or phosphodiesterase